MQQGCWNTPHSEEGEGGNKHCARASCCCCQTNVRPSPHTGTLHISCVVSPVHAAVDSADLVSVLCGVTACCPG